MSMLNRLVRRLARPEDQARLDANPRGLTRVRVIARVAMRFWWVYALLLVFSGTLVMAMGMDIYHRTEMPQFCGACHEMQPNFQSWEHSRHANVRCIDCHARPGLSGWMSAKLSGVRQLVYHFTADEITDIELKGHHREIVSENCQRCHEEAVRTQVSGDLAISHQHHLDIGALCVACHSGRFAHPESAEVAADVGLADRTECYGCHDGENTVGDELAFNARDEANCTRCHPDSGLAVGHGAGHASVAERKPCLDCHDQTAGHFKLDLANQADLCAKCHELPKLANAHPPYEEGACNACHSVMSPAHTYGTGPKPSNALCFKCHDDMEQLLAEGGQMVSSFSDNTTDLHREHQEFVGSDDEAWCLGCHSPHASASSRAMVALRTLDADRTAGEYTPNDAGGSCSGACHDGDEMEYARAAAGGH